jgi:hypothetical protein
MILDLPETVEQPSQAPFTFISVLVWVLVYKPSTQTTTLLPARSRSLALHLARGRGSPPLRFASTRGPPSSTNTSQMFMARPDAERGARASGQQRAEVRVQERGGLDSEVGGQAGGGDWKVALEGLVVVRSDGRKWTSSLRPGRRSGRINRMPSGKLVQRARVAVVCRFGFAVG